MTAPAADLDLTAAIEAVREYIQEAVGFDGGVAMTRQATEVVNLVAPLIAAQVAEQIAAAIEAEIDMADHAYVRTGMRTAARVAREAVR